MREQLKKLAALKYASHEMSGDAPPAATTLTTASLDRLGRGGRACLT